MRRRRVTFALIGAFVISVALGMSAYPAAWWLALAVAVLALAYRVMLAQVRRTSARREWDLSKVGDVPAWDGFYGGLVDRSGESVEQADPALHRGIGPWGLARFAVGYLASWLLTPVIAVAEQIAGGARADSRRQRWLEQLQRMQHYGRQQSVTALKVSMVATAGVGSFAALGFSAGTATAAPLATAASTSTHYTVAAGDTLGSVAARFGTTVSALAAANGIADPNLIYVGQELVVGAAAAPSTSSGSAPSTGSVYTVQAGDTLGAIAARFGTTVSALAAANGIANSNLIVVGQVLHLDTTSVGTAPPRTSPVATSPVTTKTTSGTRQTYTVQAGDTLAAIAARYDTTVSALASANGIADPNLIVVGQVLVIGGGSVTTAPVLTSAPTSTSTPTSTPAPTTTTTSSAAATAVRVALAQIGKPYVWGGAGPSSFDCSGLVMYAYAAAGISLPHYTVSQFDDTTPISESQLEPGDLVFYDTGSGAQPGHVTMYIGNGQVVSANSPGTNVQTQSIGYDGTIMGFRRVAN